MVDPDVTNGPGTAPSSLDSLLASARQAGGRGPAPVHLWNPAYCGEIDMRIARDGTWFYGGTPIGRPALVKLFASVLRRDPERFVLVTPVERVGIAVEDAPFLAVEMAASEAEGVPLLTFRTNVDDVVAAGPDHPLRFEREPTGGLRPYLLVRGGLEARLTRTLFYDLVERGEEREVDGRALFGVASGGSFFPMAEAADIAGLA